MKDYIGLAYQFFTITREAINEMEKQGNKSIVISDTEYNEEKSWKAYDEKTKWNDFNIGVPVLFNFYHGLELFMKGLLQELNPAVRVTNHKLTGLESKLKLAIPELPKSLLDNIKKQITSRSPFHEFFQANKLGVDKFYELLKYPDSKQGQEFCYSDIRGKEQLGLSKFQEIRKSTIDLREEFIKWKKRKNGV
jgi:hypothetical protein